MNGAGNGDRMNSALRHFLETALAAEFQARRRWRSTAGIEGFDFLFFGGIEKAKGIATDADGARFDHAEHCCGCDCRLDSIAAVHEDLHAGERRQWLARRDHAVFSYRGKFFCHDFSRSMSTND